MGMVRLELDEPAQILFQHIQAIDLLGRHGPVIEQFGRIGHFSRALDSTSNTPS
jgi:hypothetical protein